MSVLVRRCLGRSRLVEQLVENWQIEHDRAMFARDVDELVRECLDLGALIQHTWKTMWGQLFDEQIDNFEAAGNMLRSAIKRALRSLEQVQEDVVKAEEQGYTVDNAAAFRNTVAQVKQVALDFKTKWPKVNRQMVEASLAAYSRGEYQEAGELLCESQGSGTENH